MRRRLLVDLLGYTGGRGGTETYARELLPRLASRMPEVAFAALANRDGFDGVRDFFPGRVHEFALVGGGSTSWAAGAVLGVDAFARSHGADGLWCPANFGPLHRSRVPRAVTVHDMIYAAAPSAGFDPVRRITAWLQRWSARTADRVITVSSAAADDIARFADIERDGISVIHNGAEAPHSPADPTQIVAELGVPSDRPIVLTVGNRMPHKNLPALIAALASMAPEERPFAVVAGGGDDDPLRPLVDEAGLASDVLLPGWLDPDQLEALYAVADVYVCPSLVEGFGLPVVDALRRGCAVVANDVPVLREIGGPTALFVEATRPEALAAGIRAALTAPVDADRQGAGVAWASQFTWDTAADATAEVLRGLLSDARSRS